MSLAEDESRAFWGAAAQIVPIIALALVIETRVLVGRWKSKKFKKYRASRWALGLSYAIVVLPLPNVLLASLANTAQDSTSRIEMLLVTIWIGAGIYLVAYIPAWRLISVALADLFQLIGDWLPWSRVNRIRRSLQHSDQLIAADIRYVRGLRISRLMLLADIYIEFIPLEIAADRIGWPPNLLRQNTANHVRLAQVWEGEEEAKQLIQSWETRRRDRKVEFNASLIEREKNILKHMNRNIAEQLAGIPR